MEDVAAFRGRALAMEPRIPVLHNRHAMEGGTATLGSRIPSRVQIRDAATTSSDCAPGDNTGLCEKPASGSSSLGLAVGLGIGIPAVLVVCAILYIMMRRVRREQAEDRDDKYKSMDFGLGENYGPAKKGSRRSILPGGGEKDLGSKRRQMSMDLNLSSPYLLPPGLQSSRESLHSLARTLHQNEDPYRPVGQYASEDGGSMRSLRKDGSSVYTGSTRNQGHEMMSIRSGPSGVGVAPSRTNSIPKSPLTPPEPAHLPGESRSMDNSGPLPPLREDFMTHTLPTLPDIQATPYPEDSHAMPPTPEIQEPPNAASKITRKGLPTSPSPLSNGYVAPPPVSPNDSAVDMSHDQMSLTPSAEHSPVGLKAAPLTSSTHMSPPALHSLPSSPRPPRSPAPPAASTPIIEEPQQHEDDHFDQYDLHQAPHTAEDYDGRGRTFFRESTDYHQPEMHHDSLGVPQQSNKRLSVGFRPLPPDEYLETEDPEHRANRIRSFYKEYFDESKPDPNAYGQAVPPIPAQYAAGNNQYYEDYDAGYHGEAAFYDPASNAFVMPYSQPVARRAMTPPPSGSRFPGPRSGPRPYHGSMGGMSTQSGFRGPPPRPGSSASNSRGPPRSGSSMSGAWGRPRAGSTLSGGRFGGQPRKPMPPPTALTTLPNPSKLKDDSFAIFNASDFAPPDTFKDRAAGRSQSPIGERRPYQLNVPVHSPLVSSYDDMAALPSPHLLRKSGTFTGLDFAPPKKFIENDSRSETGSIRSNRSGLSAANHFAIRTGAGRVSRLPGDTVFSQAAMSNQLKPSWTMRD